MSKPCISADSHITEPPNCYIDYIDPKFRDIAPKIVRHETKGDLFVIDGMKKPLGIGLAAAAGKKPEDLAAWGATFESLHRGGWDPKARLADQDRDGRRADQRAGFVSDRCGSIPVVLHGGRMRHVDAPSPAAVCVEQRMAMAGDCLFVTPRLRAGFCLRSATRALSLLLVCLTPASAGAGPTASA